MNLYVVIEKMETGDQDAALMALQSFNKEKGQCFTFNMKEQEEREDSPGGSVILVQSLRLSLQRLGELAMGFLNRELQPSCQLACLETIRILSRDKGSLGPFCTRKAVWTLSWYAGLACDADGATPEMPDPDVNVEALKCLCNVVFTSEEAREAAAHFRLVAGLADRLKQCRGREWNPTVRFFDLRLTFLLTALCVDVRAQLAQELRGVSLLSSVLDATLGLRWLGAFEVVRPDGGAGAAGPPPLSREETECAMEILKILFNITLGTSRRKVDEEDAAVYRHLVAVLRPCLMSVAHGEDRTEEFHSHTVNLLGNLPLMCLDVLLLPKVQQGSIEYLGVNMDSVNMLLQFMERRLDKGTKVKETLLPCLNLLTESSRVHRETRKFLRTRILPPLRDVKNRPEVGNTLRNKLVRLMTHIDTDVKHCSAELLFVLCKESVSRFIKYTGYGNAAGLLAARGLMQGAREPGHYSEDEESDTEEYREAKPHINPVTGRVEDNQPNPMNGMTEEQKEFEAMKLVNMFDKLSRDHVIQPMKIGPDGKMTSLATNDLQRMTEEGEQQNSESEEENA